MDNPLDGLSACTLLDLASISWWSVGSLMLHKRIILDSLVLACTASLLACLLILWILRLQSRGGIKGHLMLYSSICEYKVIF